MRKHTTIVPVLALLVMGLGAAGMASAKSPLMKEIEDTFVRLHEDVRPCVVNINTKSSASEGGQEMVPFEDLFRMFGMPVPQEGGPGGQGGPQGGPQGGHNMRPRPMRLATGSGFIYDKEGHIITNNHVVEGTEDGEIIVRLWDGKECPAKVVGRDPDTDLAVIKIDPPEDLPVAKLGDSESLKVGQFAIAMGSPRGLEGSLCYGHVSALGREGLEDLRRQGLRFQNLIQTDAAINLGNSGGPLCNIDGEVIGISVAIVFGANSLGFAIPINTAKEIVPQLISSGKIARGFLGVGIDDLKKYSDAVGLPDNSGAFVKEVKPGTPAEKAEIKPYDVIRKVNGETVKNAGDLQRKIGALAPGAKAKIEIWRDKAPKEMEVQLDEWAGPSIPGQHGREALGLRVSTIRPDAAEHMGLKAGVSGVVVMEVSANSPAEDAGLVQGDIIDQIAQQPVKTEEDFYRLVKENAQPGKSLLIGYIRGGREHDITVIKVPKEDK